MDEEHETADPKKRSSERPRTATTKKNHNIPRRLRDTSRGNSRERERGDSFMVLNLWAGYRGEGGSILRVPHKEYRVPFSELSGSKSNTAALEMTRRALLL